MVFERFTCNIYCSFETFSNLGNTLISMVCYPDYKLEAGKFQLEEVENLFGIKQKMDSMSGSGLSAQLQVAF